MYINRVLIVTGLENEEGDIDDWMTTNKEVFEKSKMTFRNFACITATKGKGRTACRRNMRLRRRKCSGLEPWKMPRDSSWQVSSKVLSK